MSRVDRRHARRTEVRNHAAQCPSVIAPYGFFLGEVDIRGLEANAPPIALLSELLELFTTEFAIAKDFGEQSRADVFTGMDRDYRRAAVGVVEKMVAALNAHDLESGFPQCSY
jgi:hypothetical protein